jgi:uncharacterized membrane protein YecN with MAPEG domain
MVVTPLYAGLLTLLYLVLIFQVIRFRQQGISLGDGGDPKMLRVIRGHANFAEHIPLALLLMLLMELSQFSSYLLHALGIALVVSRALHAYALSFTQRFRFGRVWGAGITFAVLAIEAGCCIYHGVKVQLIW